MLQRIFCKLKCPCEGGVHEQRCYHELSVAFLSVSVDPMLAYSGYAPVQLIICNYATNKPTVQLPVLPSNYLLL